MHLLESIHTIPSGLCWLASVGHTSTQGASLHWLHRTGKVLTSTTPPPSVSLAINFTQVTLNGRKCSILQAATQAWQRLHFTRSITIPHLMVRSPFSMICQIVNQQGRSMLYALR
jgi:hypothetical protein